MYVKESSDASHLKHLGPSMQTTSPFFPYYFCYRDSLSYFASLLQLLLG